MLRNEEMLNALKEMNMFSDVFFKEVVRDFDCACYLLEAIIPGADVVESCVQKDVSNPIGRSNRADLLMKDRRGMIYNLECQREKGGFPPKRSRFYKSLITSMDTPKNIVFKDVIDVNIIIFYEKDPCGSGKDSYEWVTLVNDELVDHGERVIYVNGEANSDTSIGRVARDMRETDPNKIESEVLRKRIKFLKETQEGRNTMCTIMERFYKQGIEEGKEQGIVNTIVTILKKKLGLLSEDTMKRIESCTMEQLHMLTIEVSDFESESEVRSFLLSMDVK